MAEFNSVRLTALFFAARIVRRGTLSAGSKAALGDLAPASHRYSTLNGGCALGSHGVVERLGF